MRATGGPGGWTITGLRGSVIDGQLADLLIIVASTDGGPGMFVVDRAAAGVHITPLISLDLSRRLARVELADGRCR